MTAAHAHLPLDRALARRLAALHIREEDLDERFVRGGGPGGQKINKASSCVVLRHRPTGIEVRCDRERSQAVNRQLARRKLCDRLEAWQRQSSAADRTQRERARRQTRRPPRSAQLRRLHHKRRRAERKAERRRPTVDE
ncbi:MAG: peptide chain release factor-like protein [Kiritimatiellae bacterium]|nr:peptide chain release factor-like protein [Kiritimatiellia bacterium]